MRILYCFYVVSNVCKMAEYDISRLFILSNKMGISWYDNHFDTSRWENVVCHMTYFAFWSKYAIHSLNEVAQGTIYILYLLKAKYLFEIESVIFHSSSKLKIAELKKVYFIFSHLIQIYNSINWEKDKFNNAHTVARWIIIIIKHLRKATEIVTQFCEVY